MLSLECASTPIGRYCQTLDAAAASSPPPRRVGRHLFFIAPPEMMVTEFNATARNKRQGAILTRPRLDFVPATARSARHSSTSSKPWASVQLY